MGLLKQLRESWRALVVILTPVVLSPLVIPGDQASSESKCAYMLIIVSIYWITESLPLPVTALLPVALCPLLGIMSSKTACKFIFADISFLLLGGILVSIAIEETKLHKRFALRILMLIGVQPRRLMLGLMLTTSFLSMWISNTATTAMMIPITRALLGKLFQTKKSLQMKQTKTGDNSKAETLGDNIVIEVGKLPRADEDAPPYPVLGDMMERTGTDTLELSQLSRRADISAPRPDYVGNGEGEVEVDDVLAHAPRHVFVVSAPENRSGTVDKGESAGEPDRRDKGLAADNEEEEEEDDEAVFENLDPEMRKVLKVFSMCVCYSANVGGIATLTGTAPNLILARVVTEMSGQTPVTFANWMLFGFPASLLTLCLCYVWMNIFTFGFWNTVKCKAQASKEEIWQLEAMIRDEYRKLGKIKFQEIVVLFHFVAMVALWLTRHPGSSGGWSVLFPKGYVTDGVTAMVIALSLFIFPNERPNVLFFRRKGDKSPSRSMPPILNWKSASRKFPWGTMFLLGGGFVVAHASKVSGLSRVISNNLSFLQSIPTWGAAILVSAMTSLATEVTSNSVICILVLPILGEIAIDMHVHPLYLMLPTTAACSLAFMLPVATPPNALVFAYGDVKVTDMIKCGVILNMLGVAVISLGINTWGHAAFSLDSFPTWAQDLILKDPNSTLSDVLTTTTVPDFVGNWTISGNVSTYL